MVPKLRANSQQEILNGLLMDWLRALYVDLSWCAVDGIAQVEGCTSLRIYTRAPHSSPLAIRGL